MPLYSPEQEARMRSFYTNLNEKDRRLFAGFKALQVGHGGRNYIAGVLGCSRNTVSKGARKVSGLPMKDVGHRIRTQEGERPHPTRPRIRKPGGGRKPYSVKFDAEGLDEKFLDVLRDHTAGDPMDAQVRWTNLSPREIVTRWSGNCCRSITIAVGRHRRRWDSSAISQTAMHNLRISHG